MKGFHVRIVCVGRLKMQYYAQAQAEYAKLLSRYCTLEIVEIREETVHERGGKAQERARREEAGRIEPKLSGYVIALDPKGKKMTSEAFSQFLMQRRDRGDDVTFLIGGSTGLSPEIKHRADLVLSFSDMTMPHHLFRIVLLEQIYRAMKIGNGETYHK